MVSVQGRRLSRRQWARCRGGPVSCVLAVVFQLSIEYDICSLLVTEALSSSAVPRSSPGRLDRPDNSHRPCAPAWEPAWKVAEKAWLPHNPETRSAVWQVAAGSTCWSSGSSANSKVSALIPYTSVHIARTTALIKTPRGIKYCSNHRILKVFWTTVHPSRVLL